MYFYLNDIIFRPFYPPVRGRTARSTSTALVEPPVLPTNPRSNRQFDRGKVYNSKAPNHQNMLSVMIYQQNTFMKTREKLTFLKIAWGISGRSLVDFFGSISILATTF